MANQIFGYTEPQNVEGETFVRYAMAFKKDDGTIDLTVRNGAGEETTVNLPPDAQSELSVALATSQSV